MIVHPNWGSGSNFDVCLVNLDQTKEKDKCKRVMSELGFNVHLLDGHVPRS